MPRWPLSCNFTILQHVKRHEYGRWFSAGHIALGAEQHLTRQVMCCAELVYGMQQRMLWAVLSTERLLAAGMQ